MEKYKGTLTILLSLIVLSSCELIQTDNFSAPSSSLSEPTWVTPDSKTPSYEVTQKMAECFICSNEKNSPIVSIVPFKHDDITCFFVINFEHGYKIVSADTRIQPILAESEDGTLCLDKLDNQGVKVWLEDTANAIATLKKNNLITGNDYSELWSPYSNYGTIELSAPDDFDVDSVWVCLSRYSEEIIGLSEVTPLLETKWGQDTPWNLKMPTINGVPCVTGCVAVAVAQVLYYFNRTTSCPNDLYHYIDIQSTSSCPIYYHTGLLVSLSKSNHVNNSSRWAQMPLDSNGPHAVFVSDLMLDLGERLEMHYGTLGSAVYHNSDGSIPHLSECGINCSHSPYSLSLAQNNLTQGKPIIISGWNDETQQIGHTWVIDGFRLYTEIYNRTVYYKCIHREELSNYSNNSGVLSYSEMIRRYPDACGSEYILSSSTWDSGEYNYLHMNWGWDGNQDGWYTLVNSSYWHTENNERIYLGGSPIIHYNITTSNLN